MEGGGWCSCNAFMGGGTRFRGWWEGVLRLEGSVLVRIVTLRSTGKNLLKMVILNLRRLSNLRMRHWKKILSLSQRRFRGSWKFDHRSNLLYKSRSEIRNTHGARYIRQYVCFKE